MIVTPETCRAVVRLNKLCELCILLELYTRILFRCTDPRTLQIRSVVDLLSQNPHWWSPIISSPYGVNLDSRILHNKFCTQLVKVVCLYKHFFFFQALNFLVESFGLLNDLFPLPSILDAGYPVFDLQLANVLFNVTLPSILGSSLWSFGQGFPIKYLLNCSGIWHPLYVTRSTL